MAAQASDSHPPSQLHDSRGSLPSFDPTRHANRRQTKIVKLSRTDPHAGIAPQPPNNCVPTVLVISGRLAPTSQKHLSFPNHGGHTPAAPGCRDGSRPRDARSTCGLGMLNTPGSR